MSDDPLDEETTAPAPMKKRSEAKKSKSTASTAMVLAETPPDASPPPAESSSSVAETSGQLNDELKKSRYDFPTAQVKAKEKPIRADFARIVETVWIDDVHAAWERVKKSFVVNSSEHAVLHKALGDARQLSYDAHRLYITAKLLHDDWEAQNEPVFGAMWNQAVLSLQSDKESGQRSKQITDADVRARCATLFADQWSAQESKRRKYKLTTDSMAQIAKDANEHCEDLRVRLSKLRG